jgi:hypothetical protein
MIEVGGYRSKERGGRIEVGVKRWEDQDRCGRIEVGGMR